MSIYLRSFEVMFTLINSYNYWLTEHPLEELSDNFTEATQELRFVNNYASTVNLTTKLEIFFKS